MKRYFLFLIIICSCSSNDDAIDNTDDVITENPTDTDTSQDTMYFPPLNSFSWETISPEQLEWNQNALTDLDSYLETTNTKAFIILKDGRIAFEKYYQNTDPSTRLIWNSAAKILTASTIGIAQYLGNLDITNPSADYLGDGWTAMTSSQEQNITVRNQLTMTTGGDYNVSNLNCTNPACLEYLTAPSTEWYYHNAFYILLQDVVSGATGVAFEDYFDSQLQSKIGMNGVWVQLGFARVYLSTARDAARYGLLSLNNGLWDTTQIISSTYFTEMTTPSQELNKAYGYLWWLNGEEDFRLPGTTVTFSGKLIPTAPDDLIAALGKDDQKVYVLPSEDLVVIRLGDASGDSLLGPSGYDTTLWEKIMEVID